MYRFTAHGIGKHTEAFLVNPYFVTINKLSLVLVTTVGLAPIAGGAGRDPLPGRWRAVALRSRRLLSPGERRARSRESPAVSESCAALTLGLRVHPRGARAWLRRQGGPSACRRGAPRPRTPSSGGSALGCPRVPASPLTWLGLRQRLGLLRRGAGPGAQLVGLYPGGAASSLRLWLRLRVAPSRAASVAAPPLRAVPQDVLDEEGRERLGRGWRRGPLRFRLPGQRLRGPQHPGCPALAQLRQPAQLSLSTSQRAYSPGGSAPRRPPIGRGTGSAADWPPCAPGDAAEREGLTLSPLRSSLGDSVPSSRSFPNSLSFTQVSSLRPGPFSQVGSAPQSWAPLPQPTRNRS